MEDVGVGAGIEVGAGGAVRVGGDVVVGAGEPAVSSPPQADSVSVNATASRSVRADSIAT